MLYHLSKSSDSITISLNGTQKSLKGIMESLKDGRYTLELKQIRQLRTISQNRYYWACLGMIAEEVGYINESMTPEDKSEIVNALHELFKDRFLGSKTIRSSKDKRKRIKIKRSTTTLDSFQFSKEYMDKIKLLHPYLPNPDDKNLMEFVDKYYFK